MLDHITGIEAPVTNSSRQLHYIALCRSGKVATIKGKSIIFGSHVFPAAIAKRVNFYPKQWIAFSNKDSLKRALS